MISRRTAAVVESLCREEPVVALRARAVATPKLHVADSELAARLLRLSPGKIARLDATSFREFGHLFETFVVSEILKQVSWMEGVASCGHWRTHDGAEVDLVVERDDGGIVGIEVKAGSRVLDKDLTGLRILKDELGDALVAGAILHAGHRAYTVEERFKRVENVTALIWKLLGVAEKRFRKLDAPHQLKDVFEGRKYKDGKPVSTQQRKEAA